MQHFAQIENKYAYVAVLFFPSSFLSFFPFFPSSFLSSSSSTGVAVSCFCETDRLFQARYKVIYCRTGESFLRHCSGTTGVAVAVAVAVSDDDGGVVIEPLLHQQLCQRVPNPAAFLQLSPLVLEPDLHLSEGTQSKQTSVTGC